MLKKNKEKGVTLIALVVTIIVLLILAGISIAMLTGENGILTNAQKAKVETRGAAVEEARNIWKATKETDKLANSTTAQTLEELINDLVKQKQLTEDEKDTILGNEEKGIEAEYKITIGSRTIEFIKMIDFSIDDDSYRVEEGTTWGEFLKELNPSVGYVWAYQKSTDLVGKYYDEFSAHINVLGLTDESFLAIKRNSIIRSRKI